MPYSAEISRQNPTCFLFLIDQSGSMQDPWGEDPRKRKADEVANIINKSLSTLVVTSSKSEGIRDYFHIGVIGYGRQVAPAYGGLLSGKELVPVREVADNPVRIEQRTKKTDDGAGGLVDESVKFPIWFDPVADNGTPMCLAITRAQSIIQNWLSNHQNSYPPTVFNITDGESTDGDPSNPASALTDLATSDGNVLLFNCHISSQKGTIIFPENEETLPDDYARLLFRMSSQMPEKMRLLAIQVGLNALEYSRGFVFNSDPVSLIQLIDIGTRAGNLR